MNEKINSATDCKDKPLVTFALFAYNQEKYIRDAIYGAFSQTYQPLEIILSDDFSTDNTYRIIEEEVNKYNGSHHIILNRNKQNLGVGGHVNKVMELAHGDHIDSFIHSFIHSFLWKLC